MQKYTDVVTSARSGSAIPDASVTVKTHPGAVVATIYSDDGVTTKANPLTTDENGEFSFYAADGDYTLTVSGTGITERTIGPITLLDPNDEDETTLGATDVNFTQSGSGATAETVQDVLRGIGKTPQQFGALADGSNDDTAEIQAAIDAIEAEGGGFLYLPEGTYKISAALTLQDTNNVKIFSHGAILQAAAAFPADYMLKVSHTSPNSGNGISGLLIQGIAFDGDEVAGVLGAISVAHVRAGMFIGLRAVDFPAGGLLAFVSPGASRTTQSTVLGPEVDNCLYGLRFLGDADAGGFVTRTSVYSGRLRGRGTGVAGGIGIQIGDTTETAGDTGTIDVHGTDTAAFEIGVQIFGASTRWGGTSEGDGLSVSVLSGSTKTRIMGSMGNGITDAGSGTRIIGANTHANSYRVSVENALAAGDNNDYALRDETEVLRIPANAGGSTITGIDGGYDGRRLTIINRSGGILTLGHQDTGSAEENRIICNSGGTDLVMPELSTAELIYDGNQTRWWVLSSSG